MLVYVVAVYNFIGRAWLYNLTVDDLHTYFVLAGTVPVLVHNDRCIIGPEGWKHVNDFHRKGGVGVDDSKGVLYGTDAEVEDRIRETVQRGTRRKNTEGRDGWLYEWDFGKDISEKSATDGSGTSQIIGIIVNPDGTLRTAHPV